MADERSERLSKSLEEIMAERQEKAKAERKAAAESKRADRDKEREAKRAEKKPAREEAAGKVKASRPGREERKDTTFERKVVAKPVRRERRGGDDDEAVDGGDAQATWRHDKFRSAPAARGYPGPPYVAAPAHPGLVYAAAAPVHPHHAAAAATAAYRPAITLGTKVMVSGLDPEITSEDLRDIFSKVGELKTVTIHYDAHNKPKGAADIVYRTRDGAEKAVAEYDGRQVDDARIRVRIIESEGGSVPVAVQPPLPAGPPPGAYVPAGAAYGGYVPAGYAYAPAAVAAAPRGRGFAAGGAPAYAGAAPSGGRDVTFRVAGVHPPPSSGGGRGGFASRGGDRSERPSGPRGGDRGERSGGAPARGGGRGGARGGRGGREQRASGGAGSSADDLDAQLAAYKAAESS